MQQEEQDRQEAEHRTRHEVRVLLFLHRRDAVFVEQLVEVLLQVHQVHLRVDASRRRIGRPLGRTLVGADEFVAELAVEISSTGKSLSLLDDLALLQQRLEFRESDLGRCCSRPRLARGTRRR